jgi:hypothetical protein
MRVGHGVLVGVVGALVVMAVLGRISATSGFVSSITGA